MNRKIVLVASVLLLASACAFGGHHDETPPPTSWSCWTEIDGAGVHYLDTAPGSDFPVLLILPGFLGSTIAFLPMTDILSREMRVIIPDLPGFGWSDAPPGGCTMEDRLAFVRDFVDLLDLGPVCLAGSSLGANIAIRFAVRNPDRVLRLLLLSPFGLKEQREVAKQVRDRSELTEDILESFYRPFRTAAGRRVVVGVTRHILYGSFFDECLPLVSQPTLALAGSADEFRSQEMLGLLERTIPSCTTWILGGGRHLIQLDAPGEVAAFILRFCAVAELLESDRKEYNLGPCHGSRRSSAISTTSRAPCRRH